MRDEAKADVFDSIERFHNPKGRHSTIGYFTPMALKLQAGLALNRVSFNPAAGQMIACSSAGDRPSRLDVAFS